MNSWTNEDDLEPTEKSISCSGSIATGDDWSQSILRYLRVLGQAGEQFNQKLQREHRVSQSQLACLNILHKDGSMPISRLAKGLVVEPSTATGVVDRLEQKGLVERTRQGSDRRVITIQLTETGRGFAESSPPSVPGFLRIAMKELSHEEAKTIIDALAKLVELLQRPGAVT